MPVLETLELSEYQNWVWSSLKDWLRWKGLYLFCAPSLLLELAQEGHLSPHTAKAVIGNLEGYFATRPPQWRCSTKAPEQYGRQPLKGLWKAHVPFQDRSTIMKNLSNEINQSWMDRWFKKLIEPNDTHPLSEEQCGKNCFVGRCHCFEKKIKQSGNDRPLAGFFKSGRQKLLSDTRKSRRDGRNNFCAS